MKAYKEEDLPLYVRGNPQLLNYLDLRVQMTINLIKPYFISLPLRQFNVQKVDFVQPIAQIQSVDEQARENYIKNKSLIKQGVSYIYFPSNIRVDQKIYKIYDKNYQNFVKEFPKNVRGSFSKFVMWQQGQGQHSISFQKQKINEHLSVTIKAIIEKKLEILMKQISDFQNMQLNAKTFKNLFIVRNKISSIFKQIKLISHANQNYLNLYLQIQGKFKKMIPSYNIQNSSPNPNPNPSQKIIYKSPFVIKNISTIVGYFQCFNPKIYYLQIINYTFLKVYQSFLDNLQQLEATKKFKQYLDFIISTVFNNITTKQEDISKNIWVIQTIDQMLKIQKSKNLPPILNKEKQLDFSLLNVSIISQYRNAIQKIGVVFYGINTHCVFPRNLQYELKLCIKSMKNQEINEKQYPQMKIVNNHPNINKLSFLPGQPISQTIQWILNNFKSYKLVYIRTLQLIYSILSQSPYKKVAWSMKLSVLKCTIIYFNIQDEKRFSVNKMLEEQNSNILLFSYQNKKFLWQKLQIVNKIYKLTLCKRYNIKMTIEELLNILLDNSIIHIQQLWKELVKIVSSLLFSYKIQEVDLTYIDYGQTQDENQPRRRKTTINSQKKQIQVGTMKFISILSQMQQSDLKQKKIGSKRLNIQLSNRIISYASSLIEKSKSQRANRQNQKQNQKIEKQQNEIQQSQIRQKISNKRYQKELISLKFKIKTTLGEQKIIPFEIIQCEDKFIEIQVKSQQVLICKIQKILIDINDNITLVYTMPINHQTIQIYNEKGEQNQQIDDHYVNISPQLNFNTIQIQENIQKSINIEEEILKKQTKKRKESLTSSVNSRHHSQNSYSSNIQIYKNLWTPLKYSFNLRKNDQVEILKLVIETKQEIYPKIIFDQNEILYNNQNLNLKLNFFQQSDSDSQIDENKIENNEKQINFIIFVKPHERMDIKDNLGATTAVKKQKQTINFIQKKNRNRNHSLSKSFMSSQAASIYSVDSNRLFINVYFKHQNYYYNAIKQINYGKRTPFQVQYRYAQQFQEYTIRNLCLQKELKLICHDNEQYNIAYDQQLKLFNSQVTLYFTQAQSYIKRLKIDQKLNLKYLIKKQHLKPQKISSIWLSTEQIDGNQAYRLFQPIQIISQQQGTIQILKSNHKQYELIGKIEGLTFYLDKENKLLDLFLIPTKKGNIKMPQISINGKKGSWKNKIITVI